MSHPERIKPQRSCCKLLLWSGSEYPEVLLSLVRVVLPVNEVSGMFGVSSPCYFFYMFPFSQTCKCKFD